MGDTLFFYAFALLALLGALGTILFRSAVHCALALMTSLFGVAGLYLLQGAEFLFAVQIVLYIGGIMVLFLFVIMLVNLDEAAKLKQFNSQMPIAAIATVGTAAVIYWFTTKGVGGLAERASKIPQTGGNVENVADMLFSQYLLPFELASVLLLVAVVGSVIMARKRAQ